MRDRSEREADWPALARGYSHVQIDLTSQSRGRDDFDFRQQAIRKNGRAYYKDY